MKKIIFLMTFLFTLPVLANTQFTSLSTDPSVDPPASWGPGFTMESIALQTTENISGDSIAVGTNLVFNAGDKIVITVTGGATFANTDYSLEQSAGGAGTGILDYAVLQGAPVNGDTSITFIMQESVTATPLSDIDLLILSGDAIAGQSVLFNLPGIPGTDISIRADIYTSGDVLRESTGNYLMFESSLESAPASPIEW